MDKIKDAGHSGEILDLSWSHTNCLISSSVDKTVCLWRVGCNHCLKVFSHNNYVTSIQFNPMDGNLFISGSIDGKVKHTKCSTKTASVFYSRLSNAQYFVHNCRLCLVLQGPFSVFPQIFGHEAFGWFIYRR